MKSALRAVLIIFTIILTVKITAAQEVKAEGAPKVQLVQAQSIQTTDKKMAVSAGLGIGTPTGDLWDNVKFPIIPLFASFQYAVVPFLSIEADSYLYLYSELKHSDGNYNQYQFGASARYWFNADWSQGNAYNGIYLGAGLARTKVDNDDHDKTFWTFVFKGGYVLPLNSILLDFGARYDVVDFEDWFDQALVFYAMAMYRF